MISLNMRYLEKSNSETKGEWCVPAAGGGGRAKGMGSLMGTEFQFYRKKFWSLVSHNNENILGTTELYTYSG